MTTRGGRVILLRAADFVMPVGVLGALLLITRGHGGGTGTVVLALAVVLFTQVLPGAVLWRLMRGHPGSCVEDLGLGGGLGIAVAGLLAGVGGLLHLRLMPMLLPLAAVVLLLVPPVRRAWRSTPTGVLPPPGWTAAVAATGLTFLAKYEQYTMQNPVRWSGWMGHYVDMPYHLAMAAEVLHHGPEQFSWVAGTPMRYPWLFYGWSASIVDSLALPLDEVVLRAAPVALLTLLPFTVAAAAWRLSGRAWAGPVAAFVALGGGLGLSTTTSPGLVILNSPTNQLGLLLLAVTVGLLALRWRGRATVWTLLGLVVLFVSTLLAKGGPYPVLVGGMGLAAAAWLLFSRSRANSVVPFDFGVSVVVLGLGFKLLLGGAASDLVLDPLAGLTRSYTGSPETIVNPFSLALGVLLFVVVRAGAATASLLLLDGESRLDVSRWLPAGAMLAGLGAALLLYQSGMSQIYFLYAGAFVGGIGAGWGITDTGGREGGRRVVAGGALAGTLGWLTGWLVGQSFGKRTGLESIRPGLTAFAVILVVALVVLLAVLRRTPKEVFRGLAVAVTVAAGVSALVAAVSALPHIAAPAPLSLGKAGPGIRYSWSQQNVEAARYLQSVSSPSEEVMTNRHCTGKEQPGCDRRAFVLAAYSERRVLVEGWAYTPEAIAAAAAADPPASPPAAPFWDPALLTLNDEFFVTPTRKAATELWDRGVRWIYVDREGGSSGDLTGFASQQFANAEATVYRLADPHRGATP